MAYNPFNIFRRNQKALFAVLTVFIMVMFTLQSGVAGGDFFEMVSRWLGAKGAGSKEAVCTIDGHKVTGGELDGPRGVKFKRVMANRFMYYAARQTAGSLLEYASQQRERLSEGGKVMADTARQAYEMLIQFSDPKFASLFQMLYQRVGMAEQAINEVLESPTARAEDKDVARAFRTAFALSRYLQQGQSEHYFLNAPNRTQRDLIEFLLWEKKADQLGIRFTKSDVNKLIQNEFYNRFYSDVEVRKILAQTPGFTMDTCLEAIATEFRVRTAQTAVLGYVGRSYGAPTFSTPYELFEYYREQTSPTTYEVLSVPATAFVDKVSGTPTDNEITELFKKYASDEPNPRSETPGFKEPRKIALAYLGITGDEPYYKKLATEQIKVGEVMAKASGLLAVPLPGAVDLWTAGAVAPLGLKEPAVDAAYSAYVREFDEHHKRVNYSRSTLPPRSPFSTLETGDPLLPTSVVRPGVAAAAVGAFVGQSAGFGNVGSATTLAMTAPLAYEIRDRVKVGMPLVLGWMSGPALLPTLASGAAVSRANEPKPLPIEVLRPELLKQAIDKRAKALAFGEQPDPFTPVVDKPLEEGDVTRFTKELGKLTENGKPKDKAAADKYVKDFIAARGLAHSGTSIAPRDEWALEDDPGLQVLVQAQKESLHQLGSPHGGQYMPFGRSFFWKSEPDPMGMGTARRVGPTTGTYDAQTYPPGDPTWREDGRPHYIVWRTEDIPPKPTNAITARPAAIAAWKRMKAREMAQAYANALAEKIRANPATDPLVLESELRELHFQFQRNTIDPKASDRVRLFQLDKVAPITTDALGRVQPFTLTESANIPYPTLAMVTALIENRDKPVKTVLVLPDAPKDTFYVATLMKRQMKELGEFKDDVYTSRQGDPRGPMAGELGRAVRERFREETMLKARQSVVELLKKEFKYEETDDQKKKLDENAKSGGRGND